MFDPIIQVSIDLSSLMCYHRNKQKQLKMKKIITLILLCFILYSCNQKSTETEKVTLLTGEVEKRDLVAETGMPVNLIRKIHMDKNLLTGKTDTLEDYKMYKIETPNGGKMYFIYTGLVDTVLLRPLPNNYAYMITYEYGGADAGGYPEMSVYGEYPVVTKVEMLKMKSKH